MRVWEVCDAGRSPSGWKVVAIATTDSGGTFGSSAPTYPS